MAKNDSSLLGGILIGAVVGAVVGLLTAPASGKETRKKLEDESKKLADKFGHAFDETAQSIKKKYDSQTSEGDDDAYLSSN